MPAAAATAWQMLQFSSSFSRALFRSQSRKYCNEYALKNTHHGKYIQRPMKYYIMDVLSGLQAKNKKKFCIFFIVFIEKIKGQKKKHQKEKDQ
jgi:hypothetical protein